MSDVVVAATSTDSTVITSEVAIIFGVVGIKEGRCDKEYIHFGYLLAVVLVQRDLMKRNRLLKLLGCF